MRLFKRKSYLKATNLSKSALEKIEKEIASLWGERKERLLGELKEKLKEHNKEVKAKKYSYVLFTDSEKSKHFFSNKEIINYLEKNGNDYIESKSHYPISEPKITYKDSKDEYEVSKIKELFNLNIKERFNVLQIEVNSDENKAINIAFSSNYDVAPLYDNIVTVSSNEESWTLGTLEKITEILKRHEKPFPFLYEFKTLISVSLFLSILTIYTFHKVLNFFQFKFELFGQWLTLIAYFVIFLVLVVKIGLEWSNFFPKITIPDMASYKKKKIVALWGILITGVVINAAYDFSKFLTSIIFPNK